MNLPNDFQPTGRWIDKYRNAFRGIGLGVWGQNSFYVHITITIMVVICGLVFRVSLNDWCSLIICIVIVLTAELFNSAIESMGKAIDTKHNSSLGKALDISSGAVLLAAIGASIVGGIVFLYRLGVLARWWPA